MSFISNALPTVTFVLCSPLCGRCESSSCRLRLLRWWEGQPATCGCSWISLGTVRFPVSIILIASLQYTRMNKINKLSCDTTHGKWKFVVTIFFFFGTLNIELSPPCLLKAGLIFGWVRAMISISLSSLVMLHKMAPSSEPLAEGYTVRYLTLPMETSHYNSYEKPRSTLECNFSQSSHPKYSPWCRGHTGCTVSHWLKLPHNAGTFRGRAIQL